MGLIPLPTRRRPLTSQNACCMAHHRQEIGNCIAVLASGRTVPYRCRRFFIPAAKCNLAQVPLLEHRNNISGSQNSSRFIGKGEYYVWLTEASKTWARLGLASVIVLTLAAVMHPVWPLWMKLGVWWISVIILALGLGFMILRSSAALILWLVGVEFWILPNIFLDEFDSVRELITPLYLCERNRKPNGWARATVAILLGCVSVFIFVHFDALVTLSSYDEAEFLEDTPELDIMDEMAAELEREEAEANAGAHESEM